MLWPSSKAIAKRQVSSGKTEISTRGGELGKESKQDDDFDTSGKQAQEIILRHVDGSCIRQSLAEYGDSFCQRERLGKKYQQELIEYLNLLPTVDFGHETNHTMIETESGVTIEVFHWGNSGTPILIIPGFGVTAPVYYHQIREWCRQYRVIIAHAPGIGLSRVDENASISLEGVATSFRAVLDRLQIQGPVHVIGSSWGGLVAQTFAARFRESVVSLVLLQTTDRVRNSASDAVKNEIKGNFDELVRAANGQIEQRRYQDDYHFLRKALAFDRQLTSQYMSEDNVTTTHLLEEITAPTLVVTGEKDTMITPERSETLYRRIANASCYEIKGARHFAELTHHEEVTQTVARFIQEQETAIGSS